MWQFYMMYLLNLKHFFEHIEIVFLHQLYHLVVEFLPQLVLATRRQDLPPVYMLNGAIYVASTAFFHQHQGFLGPACAAYVMPRSRSIDIDTADDLAAFELLLNNK